MSHDSALDLSPNCSYIQPPAWSSPESSSFLFIVLRQRYEAFRRLPGSWSTPTTPPGLRDSKIVWWTCPWHLSLPGMNASSLHYKRYRRPSIARPQHHFPSSYIFQHCERGRYITMTRSHEHQHSTSVFNSLYITARKGILCQLSGFWLFGLVLEALVSQGV